MGCGAGPMPIRIHPGRHRCFSGRRRRTAAAPAAAPPPPPSGSPRSPRRTAAAPAGCAPPASPPPGAGHVRQVSGDALAGLLVVGASSIRQCRELVLDRRLAGPVGRSVHAAVEVDLGQACESPFQPLPRRDRAHGGALAPLPCRDEPAGSGRLRAARTSRGGGAPPRRSGPRRRTAPRSRSPGCRPEHRRLKAARPVARWPPSPGRSPPADRDPRERPRLGLWVLARRCLADLFEQVRFDYRDVLARDGPAVWAGEFA